MSFINNGINVGSQNIISGSVIGNNGVLIAGGNNRIEHVHSFKVVACDKHGNELTSFSMPINAQMPKLELSVANGNVDFIKTMSADVVVKQCNGDIDTINTMSGSVHVESCESIGNASSMSGSISISKKRKNIAQTTTDGAKRKKSSKK